MTIEKAATADSPILTRISMESKAYWGYTPEQMQGWAGDLTVSESYIDNNYVYKLVADDAIIGYYSYFKKDEKTIKLDNLFILPEHINKGFGRLLMEDFLIRIRNTDAKRVVLDSDPNAERFYAKVGFKKVGEIPTTIPGRHLPVMEMELNAL